MSLLSRLAVQAARAYGILSSRSTNVSADYLSVAGGGGGGRQYGGQGSGGGGGAGGYLTSTFTLSTLTTYTVTVGAGGAGGSSAGAAPNGSNSGISGTGLTTITSVGGGGGAGSSGSGANGGSGGGGQGETAPKTGGAGTSGQGNAGGSGANAGGGGGGASAVGANAVTSVGGAGGAGTASSISGSSVTYAGGGGGGGYTSTAGAGGAGGGGTGGTGSTNAGQTAGTANTGGGGGGAAYVSSGNYNGAAGGSGIVIISYTSATPKFVGGTLTTSGGKQIHTFTSSGTLSPLTPVTASYLVVAGGGGGGAYEGAGGGAGGLLTSSTTLYSGATYVVTVGAGGTSAGSTSGAGNNGSNSTVVGTGLTTLTAVGGGGGGGQASKNGKDGGSGGGASSNSTTVGLATSGQGNNGGLGTGSPGSGTGGGGGGAGQAGNTNGASYGGNGLASSISGSSVTYAGGGAGYNATNGGGTGGGGNPSVPGTTNLGGGGGAWSGTGTAGAGGSGVVIISYAGSQVFNGGLVTSSGGNTIHTFTSTGALTPLTNNVNNSLRFRASASAYLNRTPTLATNRRTWTLSMWVKRGKVSAEQGFFGAGPDGSNFSLFEFQSNDTMMLYGANSGATSFQLITTQVFRDPSAWYHVVMAFDTTQATSANRIKLYINGNQVTAFGTATYPSQNYDTFINNTTAHVFGNIYSGGVPYFDGYMADINFIDGQALEPYYFGNNDSNGVWKPILYKGTYGTNGFYLTFGNTTSTTTLGYDSSPNGNNWTTNNISLTAGTTYDAMIDSPTNASSGTQPVGNYPTFNPLSFRNATNTLSNANLTYPASSSTDTSTFFTMALPTSNLFYFEGLYTTTVGAGNNTYVGVSAVGDTGGLITTGSNLYSYDLKNGIAYNQASTTSYTAVTNNQTAMFAFDIANGKMWVGANGTWFNSGNPVAGTGAILTTIPTTATALFASLNGGALNRSQLNINFGQRPFAYTPPTGFQALCTTNLPTPTILQGNKYFDATLYTGTGTTQVVVNQALFKPDWVWIKERNGAADHGLYDSVRGVQKQLESNTTTAETTETTGLTAFNSNGFTVGALAQLNTSSDTYVGWQWQAGQGTTSSNTSGSITSTVSVSTTAGFSIVTYTGNSTAGATIGHGLGVAPKMIIVKTRNAVDNWAVYHSSTGATQYLQLNNTNASAASTTLWNDTSPTSTVFYVGTNNDVNDSARTYVAYCFAEIASFSKFGSYTGNGSTDGPFVFLGFRPKFIMIKCTSNADSWYMLDTSRSTYNATNQRLFADAISAESSGDAMDILSNGFKNRSLTTLNNLNGGTYIYMAFAEHPFKNANAR